MAASQELKLPALSITSASPSSASLLLSSTGTANEPTFNFVQLLGRRNGSVLGRETILKSEHFFKGVNTTDAELKLMGAPNFRSTNLSIFGAAQPTATGLSTILRVLECGPAKKPADDEPKRVIWFSTREEPIIYINDNPYVLRDLASPFVNIKSYAGISAERLEAVEKRLKADILAEARRNSGLLLVHDERTEFGIEPCLVAVDAVQTQREVFDGIHARGFAVDYHRMPVSHEQSPTDPYIDEYFRIIAASPTRWPIVFSCGMGIGRTTYAMVIGLLVRRAQIILATSTDPFSIVDSPRLTLTHHASASETSLCQESCAHDSSSSTSHTASSSPPGTSSSAARSMQTVDPSERSRTILRLVFIIEQALQQHARHATPQSTIEWIMARGDMVDQLEAAINGNYSIINDLIRVLYNGPLCKRIVDEAIDRCATVVNLREHILLYRVRYSADCASGTCASASLDTGLGFLERYYSLITFCEYVEKQLYRGCFGRAHRSFQAWLQDHKEIWHMLTYIRNAATKLKAFRPLDDGLLLPTASATAPFSGAGLWRSPQLTAPSEDAIVIKTRAGTVLSANTILKIDHWPLHANARHGAPALIPLAGAPNFRQVPTAPESAATIYAVAQPTAAALPRILAHIKQQHPGAARCVWVNVREEPIVYINGEPYVLRDQHASLRNIKAYSGISARRLEQMELRLKYDVLAEAATFSERILLHGEEADRRLLPIWETTGSVATMQELFHGAGQRACWHGIFAQLEYHRVPITAEEPPETADFDCLLGIVRAQPPGTVFVFNCQMGVGRSTTGSVIAAQVLEAVWAGAAQDTASTQSDTPPRAIIPYKAVTTLVRLLRNGAEAKRIVDGIIDDAAALLNIRAVIEEYRVAASQCTDDHQSCRRLLNKGLMALKRYVLLIMFQAYLLDDAHVPVPAPAHAPESFSQWIAHHPEFATIMQDLSERSGLEGLAVLSDAADAEDAKDTPARTSSPGIDYQQRHVDKRTIRAVVETRRGAVLAPMTILKFDHFIGCQKHSLPDRIDGAPNFRMVALGGARARTVCGLAMPTQDAIARVLARLQCGPAAPDAHRRCLWISMREEPVVFVNGLPFVLRVVKDPVSNVEMTGIVSERVELMEERLRREAQAEAAQYAGHILLHEEELDAGSLLGYEIVPTWRAVTALSSPAQAFHALTAGQHCPLRYVRVPVTDEQAPIPVVFDELLQLVSDPAYTDFVFNCQMGRGRTTTGMVITMLYHRVAALPAGPARPSPQPSPSPSLSRSGSTELPLSAEPQLSAEQLARSICLAGEYKMILSLCQLVDHGRQAKQLVDECIDACSHMQNLREAIYDFKQRAAQSHAQPSKAQALYHTGVNYLIRYFYLIVFTEFLLEARQDMDIGGEAGAGAGTGTGVGTGTGAGTGIGVGTGTDVGTGTGTGTGTDTDIHTHNDIHTHTDVHTHTPRLKSFVTWVQERREISNLTHPDRGDLTLS